MVRNDGDRMSTHGKVLCGRHAGGICAALASFCTLEPHTIFDVETLFQSHFFQLPRRRGSDSVTKNDKIYHRQVGQCFSAELCRVARVSHKCLYITSTGISAILNTCIDALADASTLDRFPTINSSILVTVGGERSKQKEKIRLEAINVIDTVDQGVQRPDIEASGIRKQKKDALDTPGPSYMIAHIWSFVNNLGHSLIDISLFESQSKDAKIKLGKLGVALLKSDDDLPLHIKLVCSEALRALGPISLERECMKRMMKLRNIFSAILHKTVPMADLNTSAPDCVVNSSEMVSLLIKALLDQLIDIATGVQYYEKNGLHEDLYIQAKARVLQFTYAQFVSHIDMKPYVIDILSIFYVHHFYINYPHKYPNNPCRWFFY